MAQLLIGLREADADLDFIIARRTAEKPGTGVVFVTPLRGDREIAAAAELGFNVTRSIQAVRIEGDNKAGLIFFMVTSDLSLTEKLLIYCCPMPIGRLRISSVLGRG